MLTLNAKKDAGSLDSNNKLLVAHINTGFFVETQTFIYQYVSHHIKVVPICIAFQLVNQDLFKLPNGRLESASPNKYSPARIVTKLDRRLFWRDPYLTRTIMKSDCSLIHAHFGPTGCLALTAKRKLGIPLVTTFYGFDLSEIKTLRRFKNEYKRLFREGELFLVEGENMQKQLTAIGCPKNKIEIQRIAISLEHLNFRPRKPKNEVNKIQVLFAGRFVEKKGLIFALKALKLVADEYDNFEFRIIGDGPLSKSLRTYVEVSGLKNFVTFLGFLPYDKYLAEMEKADLFLHPSITADDGDSEGGAPTVILEAQALGIPIISTYHADIPNVVLPGISAMLCEERNIRSLADNILWLMKNQKYWEEMGRKGAEFISESHDIVKEIELLEEKYERLLV